MVLLSKIQEFKFDKLELESGEVLSPITIAYETYGNLNSDKSNAVLICHALSGDSHVAGKYSKDDKKAGWWDNLVGSGKAIDTDRYFVICSNILGGCRGSTGPSSVNPKTKKPYALDFPLITVGDIVNAQKKLIDHFGIKKLLCVTGGSMGGMQALQWAVCYPDSVRSVIPIATTSRLSAQGIAFNEVGRRAIMADPNFNNGNYYDSNPPSDGLAIARMVGHITYLSDESMHKKFGRQTQGEDKFKSKFDINFQVESYLRHQGLSFTQRFDANSYLYIAKAGDYFDLAETFGSLMKAFAGSKGVKFLVISFTSDWLFPSYQSWEIVKALKANSIPVSYRNMESSAGHDAFLLDDPQFDNIIGGFLSHA
ncbi:MAG: homoserine O-acetyltransferase [Candidatus Saganbacteria bacterium]|nr:homoserine O-acetyltransferase [Candidatus Saganbacteria bacterium]